MQLLALVVGTRPEIIKMAPIILECKKRKLNFKIISTGQHYNKEMHETIFKSLYLPDPDYNLKIQDSATTKQLGNMIIGLGQLFTKIQPDIILAIGDTNSVLAACLAARKLNISFGHLEAGIRSFDLTMPEEINRKLVDTVSSILFAPSEKALMNLYFEGVDPKRVFSTGNTIVDAIRIYKGEIATKPTLAAERILSNINSDFILCTVHRISNVEKKEALTQIINALIDMEDRKFVFLIHPRTEKKLQEFELKEKLTEAKNIFSYESIDYLSMLKLMFNQNCKLILTDSGGLQEESAIIGKPCITLRSNTERPETVEYRVNFLTKTDAIEIKKSIKSVLEDKEILHRLNNFPQVYGDGYAAVKVLDLIENKWCELQFDSPQLYKYGTKNYFLIEMKIDMTRKIVEENFNCEITMVYDEKGQPIPIPEKLKKGYQIRIIIK